MANAALFSTAITALNRLHLDSGTTRQLIYALGLRSAHTQGGFIQQLTTIMQDAQKSGLSPEETQEALVAFAQGGFVNAERVIDQSRVEDALEKAQAIEELFKEAEQADEEELQNIKEELQELAAEIEEIRNEAQLDAAIELPKPSLDIEFPQKLDDPKYAKKLEKDAHDVANNDEFKGLEQLVQDYQAAHSEVQQLGSEYHEDHPAVQRLNGLHGRIQSAFSRITPMVERQMGIHLSTSPSPTPQRTNTLEQLLNNAKNLPPSLSRVATVLAAAAGIASPALGQIHDGLPTSFFSLQHGPKPGRHYDPNGPETAAR